ncbi:MAG: conjugative transfer signal peptidase TraF [Kiritimatiellae bacterium]|nr:conjugative transfer signal peptidase TraF [Kiritimatiellia bacterium]
MNSLWTRFANWTAVLGAGSVALGGICYAIGIRVNTSRSIPLGLYQVSDGAVARNAYVMFCPPQLGVFEEARRRHYIQAGLCPGGYGYMMKKVMGLASDVVEVADDGVRVNGRLLRFSVPLNVDKAGRPLPRLRTGRFRLGDAELLLMTDVNPASFDGRYFGPVGRSQVVAVVAPLLTW